MAEPLPPILWSIAAVVLGPVAGSFIGLLSLRLPAGRPVAVSRSACDHCHRTLGPLDLAPVFSFLLLRGRCRTCGGAIPRRYLALELGCLALGAWAGLLASGPMALVGALLAWTLLLIAIIDGEHYWLPDRLTLPLAAAGLLVAWLSPGGQSILDSAIGAGVGFAGLWLTALIYRLIRKQDGLGGGDPFLLGAIGAWVGWMGLPSVLVWACVAGLGTALVLAVRQRKWSPDMRLPFGVFLAIGAWMVWTLGPLALI
jgi:leader peptidase (prepilin peptidase)/N-methyltransferase